MSQPANPSSWHPSPQALLSSLAGGTAPTSRAAFRSLLYPAVIQVDAKEEVAFVRRARSTAEGLPTFQTQESTPPHSTPGSAPLGQPSSPWILLCAGALTLGCLHCLQAEPGKCIFFTSEETSVKWPSACWEKSRLVNLTNTELAQKHHLTEEWQHTSFSSLNLGGAEGMQWEETSV